MPNIIGTAIAQGFSRKKVMFFIQVSVAVTQGAPVFVLLRAVIRAILVIYGLVAGRSR
jgi:hypothetical protein